MRKRYTGKSRASSRESLTTPDHMPGRVEAALWLLPLLNRGSDPVDEKFFEFVGWCCRGLKSFAGAVKAAASAISRLPAGGRSSVKEPPILKERRLALHFGELADASERLAGALLEHGRESLEECAAQKGETAMTDLIQNFFGLNDDSIALCKYAFYPQPCPDIQLLQLSPGCPGI